MTSAATPRDSIAVGELVLDGVGDEAGDRVLADEADDVGQLARRMVAGVAAVDRHGPGQQTAGEVRHQAVDGSQQRRLARAGAADDEAELALGDREVDVAQRSVGPRRPGR